MKQISASLSRMVGVVFALLLISSAAYAISSVDQGFQAGWFTGDGKNITNLNASQMINGILGISYGGTGASDAATARTNLDTINATTLTTGTLPDARLSSAYAKNAASGVAGIYSTGDIITPRNTGSNTKMYFWDPSYGDGWLYGEVLGASNNALYIKDGVTYHRLQSSETILAGTNTSIAKNANGTITITSSGGGSGGGNVTAVTGSGNIYSSGGVTPDISFTGQLPVANGGTGASTAAGARTNFLVYNITNVKDYGAVGNGATDDITAIQNAINSLGNSGGTVYFPKGNYSISSSIKVGDGTEAAKSTKNRIVLRGDTIGATTDAEMIDSPQGTSNIFWNGATGGTMLYINGSTYGNGISGLSFDAATKAATVLNVTHTFHSKFEDLYMQRYTGIAIDISAYDNPQGGVVMGANQNTWTHIMAVNPSGNVAGGMRVGSSIASESPYMDVAQNDFKNMQLHRSADVSAPASLTLRFTDVSTFSNVLMVGHGGSSVGKGLEIIPPAAKLDFPQSISFVNSPIIGTINITGAWNPNGHNISFFPFTTGDYDQTPPAGFMGIKDTGLMFGITT